MSKAPPKPPDFTNPTPTTPTSGGTTSSGPSKSAGQASYEAHLLSTYMGLWGVAPPPGYLRGIAAKGMNIFEFEANERAKPAFRFSPRYNEERLSIGLSLAEKFGSLG